MCSRPRPHRGASLASPSVRDTAACMQGRTALAQNDGCHDTQKPRKRARWSTVCRQRACNTGSEWVCTCGAPLGCGATAGAGAAPFGAAWAVGAAGTDTTAAGTGAAAAGADAAGMGAAAAATIGRGGLAAAGACAGPSRAGAVGGARASRLGCGVSRVHPVVGSTELARRTDAVAGGVGTPDADTHRAIPECDWRRRRPVALGARSRSFFFSSFSLSCSARSAGCESAAERACAAGGGRTCVRACRCML